MSIIGAKINGQGQIYYFDDNNLNLKKNLTVIVNTEKGQQFATVCDFASENDINPNINYNKVVRISTKKDYLQHLTNLKDADKAIIKCRDLIKKNGLQMSIIDATYNFDRSQLIFRFIAESRVDFRQLAKELGAFFKTRIELRQVGIRDKAKEIGGLGPCGRKLCCSNFLKEFESVSINMAKNQSLSLNPSKINGVCGRLLCCLKYENDNYTRLKKNFPEVGSKVLMDDIVGKVISVDIFENKYKVLTDKNEIVEMEVKDDCKE